ncbi:MAG: polysaccharide pyruvyl transferase family protein [Candidatus Absconditabacterales bacterium]
MQLNDNLNIQGQKILLVGFRSYQNMGDELILLGTIKLLLKQKKSIYVVSPNNIRLQNFLNQFIDTNQITFIDELPRGFRSLLNFLKNKPYQQIKKFLNIDNIILGGGEILTEESAHSYYYRLRSIWPALFLKKNLYIMGGIQIPNKRYNKILFHAIIRKTQAMFLRDQDAITALKKYGYLNAKFFMDTSYFALNNRKSYKHLSDKKYIIVNINSRGQQFFKNLVDDIKHYIKKGYEIIYLPVCAGKTDDDAQYFKQLQNELKTFSKTQIKIYDRRPNFHEFLKMLGGADYVISARLHLFLISEFIGLQTKVYPYQKKIKKMQTIIEKLKSSL